MKISRKQELELEIIEEHIPTNVKWEEIMDVDRIMFFEWSEKGLHKELASQLNGRTGFHALVWGKRWRERTRDPKNGLRGL
jgi:hypothetical protein